MMEKIKRYCTSCSYFKRIVFDKEEWYGAECHKDGHATHPSMYAIWSLYSDCPYKAEKEK